MTKQNKLDLVSKAYTTMEKNGDTIHILDIALNRDMATKDAIQDIQRGLEVDFELSYEIMADACDIIATKTLDEKNTIDGSERDSLIGDDLDFWADADSRASVYTSTQLSYLNIHDEAEISDLMKDEAITSIAQACSVWYSRKVAEACEALKEYILK